MLHCSARFGLLSFCWLLAVALLVGTGTSRAQTLATRVYGLADGLPQSTVYCLAQDERGQLWAGTQGGVCWFDGRSFQTLDARQGLPDNHVSSLLPAPGGGMWLGHAAGIITAISPSGRVSKLGPAHWRANASIRQLLPAPNQQLWVATLGNGLYHLPQAGSGPVRHLAAPQGLPSDTIFQIATGAAQELWVATARGVVIVHASTGQPQQEATAALPAAIRQERVYSVHRASDNAYWLGLKNGLGQLTRSSPSQPWQLRLIGQEQGLCASAPQRVLPDRLGRVWAVSAAGVSCYQPATGRVTCFPQHSLLSDQTACGLLEDREGSMWVVLDDGILQHIPDEQFALFGSAEGMGGRNEPGEADVQNIVNVAPGVYWVGTRLGLWEFRPNNPAGRQFRLAYRRPGGDAANFVRALFKDAQGRIWLGSRGSGVAVYTPATRHWQELSNVPGLVGQNVRQFAQDKLGRVWAVTAAAGATVVLNPATGASRTYGASSGLGTNALWAAFQDREGTLWLGTDDRGLVRVDVQADGPDQLGRADGRTDHLSIGSITEDLRGHLWLGSINEGLLEFDGRRLKAYGPEAGLKSNNPYFVRCDARGRVWVGTNLGLDLFDPATRRTVSYGTAEGFLGQETNQNAVLLEPNGLLWAGTVNGLMRYDPRQARPNPVPPSTHVTHLRVFGRDTLLASGFTLPHHLNQLAFEFVGVSLTSPTKVRYQYRLAGFDERWSKPAEATSATYTNLPPGSYTFEVKAANNVGRWNSQPTRLSFTISPPWWRTWWAYALYAVGVAGAFYMVRRNTQRRERERAQQQLEYQALVHLQEMDRVKTDFFTHISHELRTPLTLILGPAEELAYDEAMPATARRHGLRIGDNARKLLRLINQLLDLSKLEAGGLILHPQAGDVAASARAWLAGFQHLAAARQIGLHLAAPAQPVSLVFDATRLEEVVCNLLANALRFTPAGGHVTLAVHDEAPTPLAPQGTVVLSVQDTGVGIAPSHLPHLFDRFYQVLSSGADSGGSGVGLALVKELTERHGGTVQVMSTPGAGTTFVVRLPRGLLSAVPAQPVTNPTSTAPPLPMETTLPEPAEDAEVVLVVDDSAEVRAFVQETLASAGYRLLEAADGPEGVRMAREMVPSLIVSDVMMPGFDGMELCRQLKADLATSHVPIVLLTARAEAADRLAGLETGADAYLPKPFDPRELRAQVRNLLALRRGTQTQLGLLAAVPEATPENPAAAALPDSYAAYAAAVAALPSLDQCFLKRVEQAIERHLDNGEFSVEMLGDEVALSRAQLHRKLKALTGQAPSDFIRGLRLRRAHVLLAARSGTVSEVAYQVGFNSPAHFSTSFSRHFGYAPSEVPSLVSS
ncbi:hybrid sensor histidine kinase/response regulator transcription factor [Hymenobacter guriensis]|uniref:histidine kinase n=1 Tax=Hymenobacter guriensis TaxID=2793065 RepID=A0ABS0L1Y5_9BACT|nr:hybrid sensor histidine kinase/response regulator transcription factor [Hymenobacter guriensis]MBG8554123.1 response regulator [Hymenobacter guriensis]